MKTSFRCSRAASLFAVGQLVVAISLAAAPARGWLNWRGPRQTGVSLEKNLPATVAVEDAVWTADYPGQSAPVIANGKLYIMGYIDQGPDLREGVACFDAE